MPQRQSQMQDATGLHAGVDDQFVMLRNGTREKIFDYMGRKPSSAIYRGRLPELARRLEEILFSEYPNKSEYYNMMRGPIETHLRFAMNLLSVQIQQQQKNRQLLRQITRLSRNGAMIVTPGITHGTSENSGMSHVTGNIGPLSFGADMVPLNANMGTLLPGEAPDALLPLGMNPTHHDRPRACNDNLVIDTVDTPATNRLLKPRVPVKEVPKEPKFSCPVCMNELVDASSTICGHIFCQNCIEASIQAQSKCPTCRRTLTMNSFHRVYLPMMD